MIAHVQGTIVEKNPAYVVLDCGGIGYQINISLHTFSAIPDEGECKIFTHLIVREDAHTLYGFYALAEKEMFLSLISVSGVGAASATMIISSLSPNEVRSAIVGNDVNLLKSVKGIGGKTAERIIVDLKDKMSKEGLSEGSLPGMDNTVREEALSALIMLGFGKSAAEKGIRDLLKSDPGLSVEQLIKGVLKG